MTGHSYRSIICQLAWLANPSCIQPTQHILAWSPLWIRPVRSNTIDGMGQLVAFFSGTSQLCRTLGSSSQADIIKKSWCDLKFRFHGRNANVQIIRSLVHSQNYFRCPYSCICFVIRTITLILVFMHLTYSSRCRPSGLLQVSFFRLRVKWPFSINTTMDWTNNFQRIWYVSTNCWTQGMVD